MRARLTVPTPSLLLHLSPSHWHGIDEGEKPWHCHGLVASELHPAVLAYEDHLETWVAVSIAKLRLRSLLQEVTLEAAAGIGFDERVPAFCIRPGETVDYNHVPIRKSFADLRKAVDLSAIPSVLRRRCEYEKRSFLPPVLIHQCTHTDLRDSTARFTQTEEQDNGKTPRALAAVTCFLETVYPRRYRRAQQIGTGA